MKNTSSNKSNLVFQSEMAGSFGINPPLGLLIISNNNLSESISDNNNVKSQDPISFLSSDQKEIPTFSNRPSYESRSTDNFDTRGSNAKTSQSRTDLGLVSDFSAENSAKTARNKLRDTNSTQYFTGCETEAKSNSNAFGSLSKESSDTKFDAHPRKFSKNADTQKSCVVSSFFPSQIELDSIKLSSPDKRRRNSKKSTASARDIPSQSEIDTDLISRLDTERIYPEKKTSGRRQSPLRDDYPNKTDPSHQTRSNNKSSLPVMQNVFDYNYPLATGTNLNYQKSPKGNMFPTFRNDSSNKKDYNDLNEMLKEEKNRNGKLEVKLQNMEGILQQMKLFHEKLYQNYVETKDELQKESMEKTNLITNMSLDSNQNEKLRIKINELQKANKSLFDENTHLKESNQKKTDVIGKLEDQIKAARSEIAILKEKHEAKIESLTSKIRKLEKENVEGTHNRDKSKGNMSYRKDLRVNTEDVFDRSRDYFRPSHKESETNETFVEGEKGIKENITQGTAEAMFQAQKELVKYKEEIEMLRKENKKLKIEAQNISYSRKSSEVKDMMQPLENMLENCKAQTIDTKRLPDANMMFKVLTDVSIEIEVENIGGILAKVKEIQEENKTNKKFVNSFLDLVCKCSPAGSFDKKPNVKQAWKWMKRLMEEYMELRKEGKADLMKDNELVKKILGYLGVKNKDDILDKIKELISENGLMSKVIGKMKAVYSIEGSVPLTELDKRLDLAMTTNGKMVNKLENRYTNLPLKMDSN